MESGLAQRAIRLACTAALAGMVLSGGLRVALGVDLLEQLPSFSICLAHWLSDVPCPGCGMLRGLLRLGQLRFADAHSLHPLALPTAIAMAWVVVGKPGRSRLRKLPGWLSRSAVGLATLVVVGVWVLRLAGGSTV